MKIRIPALLFSFVLIVCFVVAGCEEDDDSPDNIITPETTWSLEPISPAQNELQTTITPSLSWSYTPEDSSIQYCYRLYFGTNANSFPIFADSLQSPSYTISSPLEYDTQYYWKIVVLNADGSRNMGELWYFRTVTNQAPSVPELVLPEDGDQTVSPPIRLFWQSEDLENDSLTYKVQLGFNDNPDDMETVADRLDATTVLLRDMYPLTTYYWRVLVSDTYGHTTTGPIWTFRTRSNSPPGAVVLYEPADLSRYTDLSMTFQWDGTDPDRDSLIYDFYFSDQQNNLTLFRPGLLDTFVTINSLEPRTTYFWQVVGYDGLGSSVSSDIFEFSTTFDMLFPLAVGNRWEYLSDDEVMLQWECLTSISNDGYTWYDIHTNDTLHLGLTNKSNGTYEIDPAYFGPDTLKQLKWKYPVTPGDSWAYRDETGHMYTITCLATDDNIITYIGSYDNCICYQMASNSSSERFYYWIKQGVGIVRIRHHNDVYDLYSLRLMDTSATGKHAFPPGSE